MPSDRLFGPSLTTPAMADAVSDTAWLAAMLRFEAKLAAVEAQLELIPPGAATAIAAACDPGRFDVEAIGQAAAASATPVVPMVDALRREVGGDAVRFVHYGATSQDVLDTAMMLVAREALDLLLADLSALASECAALAERHRGTQMVGRTLLQQARPITFGFKAAMWLMGVLDARRRLAAIRAGRLALQLGGPVGTLDTFGPRASELVTRLARELGLAEPELPWHSTRGRVAELGSALSIAAGAAAKIALDLSLLAQTEVGEVAEAAGGPSSAMPHKRNPARAVEARSAFAGVTAQACVLHAAMAGEHERSAGTWQSEWPALSEAFRLTAGAVGRTREALTGLQVDTGRMRDNLGRLEGSGQSEDLASAQALVDRALAIYHREEATR
ncbi:MAG TPA: 3-carboxy-cis,cis-muconate cycloisomerase [Candidatus Dormibacteraeota bacterium]|nr:3-carboxy-cis,cis-muconate cycloisomerase [Candidatus Dormibacteraeota bacterium]